MVTNNNLGSRFESHLGFLPYATLSATALLLVFVLFFFKPNSKPILFCLQKSCVKAK